MARTFASLKFVYDDMDESKVRQLIEEYMTNSQFSVGPIPFHTHNGIDSPILPFSSIRNYFAYGTFSVMTLSSSQITSLHTTPITLVQAAGLNTVILVEGILARIYPYSGTAYTGANNLEFRYTNASGAKVTTDMASTFINSTSAAYDYAPAVSTELTPVANAPITVSVPVANPATGTSNIVFYVFYRVIPL